MLRKCYWFSFFSPIRLASYEFGAAQGESAVSIQKFAHLVQQARQVLRGDQGYSSKALLLGVEKADHEETTCGNRRK